MTRWNVWRARAADRAALVRLEAETFAAHSWGAADVGASYDAPGVEILLGGSDEGAPKGFSIWRDLHGEAEILSIGVSADVRRKGLGRALLSAALEAIAGAGAARVFLEVDAGNAPALALYKRSGFKKIGVRRAYYRSGADAVVMRRAL